MSTLPPCPKCASAYTYEDGANLVCPECGHEWQAGGESEAAPAARVWKDAYGNVLQDGDTVTLIKDLKIKGSSSVIKVGTKVAIGNHQRALLTSATLGSSIMFIQEQFPTVTGTIKRLDGTVVRTFTAKGGGEFARTKDPLPWRSDLSCALWGWVVHARPFPQ